jgi:hypothetical protein
MSLSKFIERENRYNRFFQMPLIHEDELTQEQATVLFRKLDSQMSPEHLHADGERPAAEARALTRMYTQAFQDLQARGFAAPRELYNL